MYRLIALDMDGTLLKSDKTISDRTKAAIKAARSKGVKVVLASGRPTEGIMNYLRELELTSQEDYVSSYNGCILQNVGTGKILRSSLLTGEDAKILYRVSRKVGVNVHAFSKTHGLVTPRTSKYTELEGSRCGLEIKEMDFEVIEKDDEIIKVMMIDEPEILSRGISLLPKDIYGKYTILRSEPHYLELFNKSSNKGTGVRDLAMHLGISREEIICVGDADNDLHMIEYAGLGVAMGNATDSIKAISDYITCSNDDDGIAHVIEKFILM